MKKQENEWKANILRKPKSRFYKLFTETLEVENYVKFNLTSNQRSVTAQLRAGILPLNIETGRFRNIKLEDRLCTLCNLKAVESEPHFLFDCRCYENLRRKFLENICTYYPNFNALSYENRLCILFDQKL